jgi:hypothetical protein
MDRESYSSQRSLRSPKKKRFSDRLDQVVNAKWLPLDAIHAGAHCCCHLLGMRACYDHCHVGTCAAGRIENFSALLPQADSHLRSTSMLYQIQSRRSVICFNDRESFRPEHLRNRPSYCRFTFLRLWPPEVGVSRLRVRSCGELVELWVLHRAAIPERLFPSRTVPLPKCAVFGHGRTPALEERIFMANAARDDGPIQALATTVTGFSTRSRRASSCPFPGSHTGLYESRSKRVYQQSLPTGCAWFFRPARVPVPSSRQSKSRGERLLRAG